MHKNNASTSALAIVFVAFAVVFIAGLAVVIPAFEEAQAVISIGDQVADVDDIPLAEFAADLIEQALAEIGAEAAPQQEDDGTDSVSVSSQDDANVEEQHSTHTTTQEHVDRNENTQGRVQKQVERQ
jgi:predicted PurR-regulated permease PerM